MPVYDFVCPECEKYSENFVPLERFDAEIIVCNHCLRQVTRLISCIKAGSVSDYERKRFPYYDESVDKTFHSASEKKRYLKEKGYTQTDGIHGIKKKRTTMYFT